MCVLQKKTKKIAKVTWRSVSIKQNCKISLCDNAKIDPD